MRPCCCINCEIQRLTEEIIVNRLSEKLKAASAVVGRQTAKIEARADALIAREAAIEAKTDTAFSPHEAVLDQAQSGLDALERQLALLSNDPLGSSGESLDAQPAPVVKPLPALEPGMVIDGLTVVDHSKPAPIAGDGRTFQRIG